MRDPLKHYGFPSAQLQDNLIDAASQRFIDTQGQGSIQNAVAQAWTETKQTCGTACNGPIRMVSFATLRKPFGDRGSQLSVARQRAVWTCRSRWVRVESQGLRLSSPRRVWFSPDVGAMSSMPCKRKSGCSAAMTNKPSRGSQFIAYIRLDIRGLALGPTSSSG